MITIGDVATKAGVSRATVSYVLNERNTTVRISDHTRERVLTTARELGYRRNELARAVITGKNRMLGFWVMHFNREPVSRMLSGAMQEADANEYCLKMIGFDNTNVDNRMVERCMEWRLAGIIAIHPPGWSLEAVYPEILGSGIPVVSLDGHGPQIASDHEGGIGAAVEHLASLGHQRIAFIAGDKRGNHLAVNRTEPYENMMTRLGLGQFIEICHSDWDLEQAEEIACTLLKRPVGQRPTAICCISDHIAMVVVRTAARLGLRVPHDLSVTGFDDLPSCAFYNPPLTSVAQAFEEMGRLAVRRLLNINGEGELPQQILPTRIIVRGSSGPVATPSALPQ